MRPKALAALRAVCLLVGMLVLATGCSTTAMKGTPFFTGEYRQRQGPVEDRVNLWPLAYYRDPALSLLWPIGEYVEDEHLAVRPLFSVYNLGSHGEQEYNVLWPMFRQDRRTGEGRLFPLLWWGEDYFTAFPLYWHQTGPDRCLDTLIPLWWYDREGRNRSFSAALGLAGYRHHDGLDSWWLAPLAGSLRYRHDAHYRFALWPLFHDSESHVHNWKAALPLWSNYRSPSRWNRMVLGLAWQGGSSDGDEWHSIVPLYLRRRAPDSEGLYTLLGGYDAGPDRSSWLITPLLAGGSRDRHGSRGRLLAGLTGWRTEDDYAEHHVFPLYRRERSRDEQSFLSLPWSSVRRSDGTGWDASPLHFRRRDADGHLTVSPLYASGSDTTEDRTWSAVPPLYYRAQDGDHRRLVTLLGGVDTGPDGRSTTLYPLLSRFVSESNGVTDLWLLAPLAHARIEQGTWSEHHLLPLYYRDVERDLTVSPFYVRWHAGGRRTDIVPPLLSWRRHLGDGDDWWIAAGLARWTSGPEAGPRHLIPLFYDNPRTGTTLSPFYCGWKERDAYRTLIPPLLSGFTRDEEEREFWSLGGLFSQTREQGDLTAHRLLPLYAWSEESYFYTPLFGARSDGFRYYLTPLVNRTRTEDEQTFRLFPLFSRTARPHDEYETRLLWGYTSSKPGYRRSVFFPLFGYTRAEQDADGPAHTAWRDLFTLPVCWYRDQVRTDASNLVERTRSHGVFPLWSYHSKVQEGQLREVDQDLLWILYDRKVEEYPPTGSSYRRYRILWRLWHYERRNRDVSVDVIPAITWDAREDGYQKASFLWRVFRWERQPDGRTALDLLFVPVLRR